MTSLCRFGRWGVGLVGMATCIGLYPGCRGEKRVEAARIANSRLGQATIAVAPAMNMSGGTDFDPGRFADLMASELDYADGILVIPVSRVLAALAAQGAETVESPSHALELAALLGADAILVFAVTEYDPYEPPSIGISAQLFGTRSGPGVGTMDPVSLSRHGALVASNAPRLQGGLLAQSQRVFDASHESVVEDIRRFAALRSVDDSPYGWRRYVVSQQEFIRYCCHATIRALLSGSHVTVLPGRCPEG